jgi:hypothetical protein
MRTYSVSYKDSDGYEGTTTVKSITKLSNSQITDILEEQLQASGIDAKILDLEVEETNAVIGAVKHYLANRKP